MSTLEEILVAEAERRGMKLRHDTHYDASNWELSWWQGKSRHRIDFQPVEGGEVAVTKYVDTYRHFPRLMIWARDWIPMFPYAPSIEWRRVCSLRAPCSDAQVVDAIVRALRANDSVYPDRPDDPER